MSHLNVVFNEPKNRRFIILRKICKIANEGTQLIMFVF